MNNEKRERDSSLERLLRDTLRSQLSDTSDTTERCLDADTLAAWAEQTLGARERAAAEAHAAGCPRCQATLAAMIRTAPPVAQAPWWRVHMMAWMVPMTAGAAALIVWLALPMRSAIAPRENAAMVARTESAASTPPPAPVEAPQEKEADQRQVTGNALRDTRARVASPDQALGRRSEFRRADAPEKKQDISALAKSEPAPAQPDANAVGEARAKAMADTLAAGQPPPAPAPAAAAPAPAAAPPVAPPAAPSAAPQEAQAQRPAPARSAIAGARAAAAPQVAADSLSAREAVTLAPIVSPNPLNRWRLLPGGAVQRSTDGGTTWQTQQTGVPATLTTGASPSPQVCWVVGPRGRVALSIDGATWKQVPLAEPIDLVAISATDDKTATVSAIDGRRFSTTDGGATWRAR